MIIKEMMKTISETTGVSQNDVKEVYEAFIEMVKEELTLENECKVVIPKLGTIKCNVVEAHEGKNPFTGDTIEVPAGRRCRMSLVQSIKDIVKDSFDEKAYNSGKKATSKASTNAKKTIKKKK